MENVKEVNDMEYFIACLKTNLPEILKKCEEKDIPQLVDLMKILRECILIHCELLIHQTKDGRIRRMNRLMDNYMDWKFDPYFQEYIDYAEEIKSKYAIISKE